MLYRKIYFYYIKNSDFKVMTNYKLREMFHDANVNKKLSHCANKILSH